MGKVLSLIVPVYNMEKYLRECLDSVILPERADSFEVITINDGSTDRSLSILKEYESNYPEIFKVIDKVNGGYGSCFNVGKEIACGKYLKMLDSDDFFNLNVFSKYLDILSSVDYDVVVNDCIKYDNQTHQAIGPYKESTIPAGPITDLKIPLMEGIFIHQFAYKKDLLSDCVCPEKTLYTDGLISTIVVFNSNSFYYSKIPIYDYRINRIGQSVDTNVSRIKYFDYMKVLSYQYEMDFHNEKVKNSRWAAFSNIETTTYSTLKGIILQQSAFENYKKYKKLINSFKDFMRKNNFIVSHIKGKFIFLCLVLPNSVGYLCGYLERKAFK